MTIMTYVAYSVGDRPADPVTAADDVLLPVTGRRVFNNQPA